jgi:hypothetical protein
LKRDDDLDGGDDESEIDERLNLHISAKINMSSSRVAEPSSRAISSEFPPIQNVWSPEQNMLGLSLIGNL